MFLQLDQRHSPPPQIIDSYAHGLPLDMQQALRAHPPSTLLDLVSALPDPGTVLGTDLVSVAWLAVS